MTPREKATAELLYFIDRFAPGSPNREIYEKRLTNMSNREFDAFIERLENGQETLALFIANLSEHKLDITRNFEIAEELGHEFFQHLLLTDPQTGQVVKTPAKHLVMVLPLRRQAQMLYKKVSIPENNQAVDERSGQPTGPSKGASISYPELQVNAAKGLDKMVLELIKYRGGDTRAFNAMNRSILETGEASLDEITTQDPADVKSTQTLDVMLKAMHLNSNLKQ
jgi:hypothetical protein